MPSSGTIGCWMLNVQSTEVSAWADRISPNRIQTDRPTHGTFGAGAISHTARFMTFFRLLLLKVPSTRLSSSPQLSLVLISFKSRSALPISVTASFTLQQFRLTTKYRSNFNGFTSSPTGRTWKYFNQLINRRRADGYKMMKTIS